MTLEKAEPLISKQVKLLAMVISLLVVVFGFGIKWQNSHNQDIAQSQDIIELRRLYDTTIEQKITDIKQEQRIAELERTNVKSDISYIKKDLAAIRKLLE